MHILHCEYLTLNALIHHRSQDSEHFLFFLIRHYNCVFQVTSVGCSEVNVPGWNPQLRIHVQVLHRIGGLLPSEDQSPRYLQIYFIDGDGPLEIETRMIIVDGF